MKIIFFDILKNSNDIIKIKECNNDFECIYIYISDNIINEKGFINKLINKIKIRYLKNIFKNKFCDKYIYITSFEFEKNTNLKKSIINILDDRYFEVVQNNTILKNSTKYIEKLEKNSKLLCITTSDIDVTYILEYIEIFKQVDILYMDYKIQNYKFFKVINNINKEYGTSISLVKSYDIKNYEIYLLFNKVGLSDYILNHKSKYIDLTDSSNDIYSNEYKMYNKYKNNFINIDNYSKTKIGSGILRLLDK